MSSFEIGKVSIGRSNKPFLIAELSGNHNQSLERALQIVRAAAESGAHALKLQTYTADTMTFDSNQSAFRIEGSGSPWDGYKLYDLYKEAYTPWEWHKPIFELCKELGLICFSTPFDETAVDFLEELKVPCYKIASFENNHFPLLKKVAQTGKPIIMSTGVASIGELSRSVEYLREHGATKIILLKCTSAYPAPYATINLNTIPYLEKVFGVQVGLSDHTLGIGVAVGAVALGACVIEKHFTLKRADGGVDSSFSMEPGEFKQMAAEVENTWEALGGVQIKVGTHESSSRRFKRGILVVKPVREGEKFTEVNIKCLRPAVGLPPMYYEHVIGKVASQALNPGESVRAWHVQGLDPID